MSVPRSLGPHERQFLEGYALGAPAAQVLAELFHDTRGAWTAAGHGADVRVRHVGGAQATLVVTGERVAEVRWDDAGRP